jgi:hypothetical protein
MMRVQFRMASAPSEQQIVHLNAKLGLIGRQLTSSSGREDTDADWRKGGRNPVAVLPAIDCEQNERRS